MQLIKLISGLIKKMGLLWVLAKNGTLEKGSVLFWDEPEANINPSFISVIAELLLELQKSGVQIFLSTHSYFLAKYIDIKKKDENDVNFFSLYKNSDDKSVSCEKANQFSLLNNNPIMKTYLDIYREELGVLL